MTQVSPPPRSPLLVAARQQHRILDVTLPRAVVCTAAPQPGILQFVARYAPSFYLDVGTACPLHCVYCSVARGENDSDVRMEAPEHLYTRMADAEAVGIRKLAFIGGEAASRTDFFHLADVAHAMGFAELILTTKSVKLARPAFVQQLVAHHISMVHLSLDSFEPEILARHVGSRTAPKALLSGLDNLIAHGVDVFLFVVLTRHNLPGLCDYIRHVAALQARHGRALPVLVSSLKLQSRAEKNRDQLVPRLTEVGAGVVAALEIAEALGVTLIHKTLPPCVLPRSDKLDPGDFALERYLTEGRIDLATGQQLPAERRERLDKQGPCERCSAEPLCPGVDTAYVQWRGWGEVSDIGI